MDHNEKKKNAYQLNKCKIILFTEAVEISVIEFLTETADCRFIAYGFHFFLQTNVILSLNFK